MAEQTSAAKTTPNVDQSKLSRRTVRTLARRKRKLKLQTDNEFAKKYFEGKSKRSEEKKTAFRKRHAKKA